MSRDSIVAELVEIPVEMNYVHLTYYEEDLTYHAQLLNNSTNVTEPLRVPDRVCSANFLLKLTP
jgi:hypothetical protein